MVSPNNIIFALDIGTRSVIGIVAEVEGEILNILAQSYTEHQSRAVYDGQIHDVIKTAEAVKKVKEELEEKVGFSLKEVSIAAAGRSLKTVSVFHEKTIDENIEIEPFICKALEIDAVKQANQELKKINEDKEEELFLCVGYSVVNYYINGYTITTLIGHTGKKIGVDVLATFLPNSVVNSLYSVLEKVGLEPVNLTLEPIAAASAIVPESFRLLNIALLDIGAGTSDIAITRDGSIVAYGMVPLAGDEITEALSHSCLADFNTAEYIKREICKGNDITYKDILGNETTVSSRQLIEELDSVLESVTDEITREIVRLNGEKKPKSVLCVGGGGQIPSFTDRIAAKLGLPSERVGLKSREAISGIKVGETGVSGPDGVTVVGIAQVAREDMGQNFINVNINSSDYKLFNSKELTVFDALGLIGYKLGDLVGRTGKDLRFYLNGERQVIFGEVSKPAVIYINDEQANLKSFIMNGDILKIDRAVKGTDAKVLVRNLAVGEGDFSYWINGCEVAADYEICDGDRVEIKTGDIVSDNNTLKDSCEQQNNGNAGGIKITVNNVEYELSGKEKYIFVDVFNCIDIDRINIPGSGKVKLTINGKEAGYTDSLKDGDIIEVGG